MISNDLLSQLQMSVAIQTHFTSFYAQNTLEKKYYLAEIFIEQFNEFELRALRSFGNTRSLKTGYFHENIQTTKSSLQINYFLLLKIL